MQHDERSLFFPWWFKKSQSQRHALSFNGEVESTNMAGVVWYSGSVNMG